MNRLRMFDWEAVAGISAAVAALVLHFLNIVEQDVLLAITLVILALILIRDLRRESREERAVEVAADTQATLHQLRSTLTPPDAVLVGPRQLRIESERFGSRARGDVIWFNICLSMFVPQSLFDALLRPVIENPAVTSVQFVLDVAEQDTWRESVLPKIAACNSSDKVREPVWRNLRETVSFILAETAPSGAVEAHLSFWGEPFMSRATQRQVPRYIFHIQAGSELIERLAEMERTYRLAQPAED